MVGVEPALDHARRKMDPIEFERAAGDGRAMTTEQAIAEAIADGPILNSETA